MSFKTIQDDGLFRFEQFDPSAPGHWLGADLFGMPATAASVRKSRHIELSETQHFVRPGEIVPVELDDDSIDAVRPTHERTLDVFNHVRAFFNIARVERFGKLQRLIDMMGDTGADDLEDRGEWTLGTLRRHGNYPNSRGDIEGPFRPLTIIESRTHDGYESPHCLQYDPVLAAAFAFMRTLTSSAWEHAVKVALGVACFGIRYGEYGMGWKNGEMAWIHDPSRQGLAEYPKGDGAHGLGHRPVWYGTSVRGLILMDMLSGGAFAPIGMAVDAIEKAIFASDPTAYAEAYGCRSERKRLEMATDFAFITREPEKMLWLQSNLEHLAAMDEDEPTSYSVQDVGYASPWMVGPFYEARGRAAHFLGRTDLMLQAYYAGMAAWNDAAERVSGPNGERLVFCRYRYDNGYAPAQDLDAQDPHHGAFWLNFLEMADLRGDLASVEHVSIEGMANSLGEIVADVADSILGDDLTQVGEISARNVSRGLGWTRKAFSYVENATRGTFLPQVSA